MHSEHALMNHSSSII